MNAVSFAHGVTSGSVYLQLSEWVKVLQPFHMSVNRTEPTKSAIVEFLYRRQKLISAFSLPYSREDGCFYRSVTFVMPLQAQELH